MTISLPGITDGAGATGATTGFTTAVPSGVQVDDLLLWATNYNDNAQKSAPSGWAIWDGGNGTGNGCTIFYKWADSTDAAGGNSYTFSDTSLRYSHGIQAWRGVDKTTPQDVANMSPQITTVSNVFVAMTPVTAGAVLIGWQAIIGPTSTTNVNWSTSNLDALTSDFGCASASASNPFIGSGYKAWSGSGSFTVNLTDNVTAVRTMGLCQVLRPASGQTIVPVGITTESDAAQPFARIKSKLVGIAAESLTAQALGRLKTRVLGIATTTETAQPLGRTKVKALGIASEADAAQQITRATGATTVPISPATETDAGQSLGRQKSKALGIAASTEAAQPLGKRKSRALGIATETSSAVSIARRKARALGVAVETGAALLLGRRKSSALGIATELDAAQSTSTGGPVEISPPEFTCVIPAQSYTWEAPEQSYVCTIPAQSYVCEIGA